jgi:hypothetical protein
MMDMTSALVFPGWWNALSAVPGSCTELDWWATDDGRHSRYERLYRVWGDPTDGVPPPYYKLGKEKHLVPTLWENFALFKPADTIALLYRVLKFDAPGPANDACWSCEFNLGHQDRQLDIVMHDRFAEGDEVLIAEAKAATKKFDDKDLAPSNVLSRDLFRFASTRRYFLLGDAAVPEDWNARGYGRITWSCLGALQSDLCESLPESAEVRAHIRRLIQAQFEGHRIATGISGPEAELLRLQRDTARLTPAMKSGRCRRFAPCAIQHLRCLNGLAPDEAPFAYLKCEPGVEQIRRHWRLGCGGRAVNEKPYWKLPARLLHA